MTAIFRREFSSYFISPIGYVYLAAFVLLAGYEYTVLLLSGSADLSSEFTFLYTVVLLLTPVLTMRLLSEERKQKTEQILFSSPVTVLGIVLGKYLAAVAVYALGLAVIFVHAIVLSFFSEITWTIVAGNLLGILFVGMASIALCLFISSQTENQIIAAIGGFAAMILVLSLGSLSSLIPVDAISEFLSGISFVSRYNNLTVGLLDVSDLIFFISFAFFFLFLTARMIEKRQMKTGMASRMITVLGLIFLILFNVVANLLTERFGWQTDLTADGRYAISEESVTALSSLTQDVDITVLVGEDTLEDGSYYVVQAYQMMKNYERTSSHLTFSYVDLADNPTFVSQYSDLDLSSWDILVESGENQEVLSFSELYDYSEDGSSITASRVEEKLTNAILSVTSEEKTKILVLTGYSAGEPTDLTSVLTSSQYEVTERSLLTDELDADAETAILYAPSSDLENTSLTKIDSWLSQEGEQGKNLFVFLDPNYTDLDNLEEFLSEWGIGLGDGYAFESNSSLYYEKFYYPIAQYADSDYAEGLTSSDLTVMPLCRPLEALYESQDNVTTDVLLSFSETSGTIALGASEVTSDNITGNVIGMLMGTHSWYGEEVTESHVVVSGSALAFSSAVMTSDTFANSDFLLGVMSKLGSGAESVTIAAKDLTLATHNMTATQANTFVWVFMVILPVVILAAGILVWLRRRNR